MNRWTQLDRARTASGDEILLRQKDHLFEIRFNGIELMSNLNHQSEGVLAERSLRLFGGAPKHVLIGGLGMGFTLRMALDCLGPDTQITICELIPEVIAWNLSHIGHLAGDPLKDPRVKVHFGDVKAALAQNPAAYDLVLMDTDNGPDIIIRDDNRAIYAPHGIDLVRQSLSDGGLACFWSATISPAFEQAMSDQPWHWRRDDVALIPGRVDACHHLYFATTSAQILGVQRKAA